MKHFPRATHWVLFWLALAISAPAQSVVINEIMYHPASENVLEEYIELYNRGATNVSLGGWSFTSGVAFTFPAGTTLGAGGYLVVAAHRQTFTNKYPTVTNVVGNWTGILNNHDQTLTLVHSNGATMDSVSFADEGDWATRRRGLVDYSPRRGWKWYAPHDGLGASLELINSALPNQYGQNWAASPTNAPTPGRVNAAANANIAPLVLDVAHAPAVPRSTNNVSVTARVLDEQASSNLIVTLFYRVDAAIQVTFSSTNMVDDGLHGDGLAGDGIFGATLLARPNNTVVEFYVRAADMQANTRTWPAPALAAADGGVDSGGGQVVNALYQVDDSSLNTFGGSPAAPATPNYQPVYKLIMTEIERAELQGIPCSGQQESNAEMNGTFISLDGTETLVRYGCGFRNRGHGSRCATPPNYHVSFTTDNRWKGVRAININAVNIVAQHMGAVLALKSGLAGADARAVQVRVNNVNRMSSSAPNYGSYVCNEVLDGDFAQRRFPEDPNGNVYRAIRDITPPEFDYRIPGVYGLYGAENKNSYTNTFFKNTNESEDDWSDLINMLRTMGTNGTAAFTVPNVRNVINVEQWMLHLAVMALYGNSETGLNSGYNDDYFMYAGALDRRFNLMYYDQDSILGISSFGTSDDIFHNTQNNGSGAMMSRFINHPEFKPIYYATLQRLLNTTFSAAPFNALCDQTLGGYAPAAASTMKNWMNARRAYVQSVINGLVPPATNNPVATVSGEPRSLTPFTNATLTVGGTDITHYKFKLNNGVFGAETPVATPITLTGLANNTTNTVYIIGKNSGGIYQETLAATVSKTWVVRTNTPRVRLNEILARNDSAVNHAGTFPDLIELYNEGPASVALTGMRLTDDPANPNQYTFPTTNLAAGAYLVLYANNADATPGLHLGFSLDQNGDGVYLYGTVASGGALLDSVVFGQQVADKSIGRLNGSGDWSLAQPTFGATNAAQSLGNFANVKLNEILTAGQSPYPNDFLELYNPDLLPVAVGGFYLTDEPIGSPALTTIAPLTFIPGGGHIVFTAAGGAGADQLGFNLSSEQGEVALFSPVRVMVDCLSYGPQRTGVAFGRCPDGALTVAALAFPSPGLGNACPVVPPPPQLVNAMPLTNTWRYDTNGVDLAANWKDASYDDSGWAGAGPALLGVLRSSTSPPPSVPEAILTPLARPTGKITYYFRTHFSVPTNATFTSLQISNVVDDGAVFYVNGNEVGRYNMPNAPSLVNSATPASSTIQDASWQSPTPATLSVTNVQPGDNVLAVEVHQAGSSSGDVMFGLRLDGLIVTNSALGSGLRINEVLANNAGVLEADGTAPDWIELYNPSLAAVDLSDLSLSDTIGNPRRWVFPTGSFIGAQGYLIIRFDAGVPASATNTGFGLKADGDSVYLFNRGTPITVLDFVNFGLQTPDFSIGRVPNGGTNWTLTTPSATSANLSVALGDPSNLKINEWMASPNAGQDDWFELYNPEAQPVALGGFWLSDSLAQANLMKYPIPALSFIGALTNGFKRFWADNPNTPPGADHTNFKLDGDLGEAVALSTPGGVLIDGVSFGPQPSGVSEGRLPDGSAAILSFPQSDSPGEANYLPLTNVVISEVLSHTDLPLEDAVEVRNISAETVNIGGWYLSDARASLRKFVVPANTVLPPGGFAVFYENQFNNLENPATAFAFSSAKGDQVYLAQATTNAQLTGYRATAKFGAAENGVSFGRHVNSQGQVDFVAMSALSLGTAVFAHSPTNQIALFRTGTGTNNPYPKVGPLLITEIMYHPPDIGTNDNVIAEFIELHNPGAVSVPLYDPNAPTNTWRLRDGVDYDFPTNLTLAPGGYLLVVSFDPQTNAAARASFQAAYGSNSMLLGPYSGKLDNSGERLELYKPDPPQTAGLDAGFVPYVLVEKIEYADRGAWSTNADGEGQSLQRMSLTGYANDATNWFAAAPTPGPMVAGLLDSDSDGMPDAWEMANGFNKNDSSDAGQDADNDGLTNLQEYLIGTNPRDASSGLRLHIALNGGAARLSVPVIAGQTYTVLRADALSDAPDWQRLSNIPAQAVSQVMLISDPSVVGGTQRFYRVVTPAWP